MTYDNVLALRISLETGLRIDDVLSIRADDLRGRTLRGIAEKTGKPYKKTISQDLANRLRGLNRVGYIFPHRIKQGEHRTRQAVWKNMKQAARILGIELNAAPHSARKTYSVELFHDKGLAAAQKELQHDNISTTMLYVFSDILQKNSKKTENTFDFDGFADLIAEKVVEKLKKPP
jgi:integrase